MPKQTGKRKNKTDMVILGKTTSFTGILKFNSALRIQGSFRGTIEAEISTSAHGEVSRSGELYVDKDAVVDADHIMVKSLTVYGHISGNVNAHDKVDMMSGAVVHGDVSAARLRIADGVLFEGRCKMTNHEKDIEIFHRPVEEIRADLQRAR